VREVDVSGIPLEVLLLPVELLAEEDEGDIVRAGPYLMVRHQLHESTGMVPTRAWRFASEDELELTLAQLAGRFAE
jgi:hypothetical protein